MEKVNISGQMEVIMKVSSEMGWRKEKELGKNISMRINFKCMKVIIIKIRNMGLVYFIGLRVMYIKVSIRMMRGKVMVKWSGLMAVDILESGTKVYSMVSVILYCQMGMKRKGILKIIYLLVIYLEITTNIKNWHWKKYNKKIWYFLLLL